MSYTSVTRLTSVPTTNPEMGYSGFGESFLNMPGASNIANAAASAAASFVNTAKGYVPSAATLRDVGMKSIAPSLVPAAWGTVGGKNIGPTFREESTGTKSVWTQSAPVTTFNDSQASYRRSSPDTTTDGSSASTESAGEKKEEESNTMLYVGIGAAVLAVGAFFLLRKK